MSARRLCSSIITGTPNVRERKRAAKRKLWKELAVLWSVAVPILGFMLLMATGMQSLFWIFQAAAAVAGIPWLIAEFRNAARGREGSRFR